MSKNKTKTKTKTKKVKSHNFDDYVGVPVIVRSSQAGVFAGIITHLQMGETRFAASMVMTRQLWLWECAEGVSLTDLAASGFHKSKASKISAPGKVLVMDGIEIVPVSDEWFAAVLAAPVAVQS